MRGGLAVTAFLVLAVALPAHAELTSVGAHAAYYNEFGKAAIGLNARETFGYSPISVGLKADYIFRPRRTTWSFEVDVAYDLPLDSKRWSVWTGGAGGVLHDDIQGPKRADFDPLASAFVGVGRRQGLLMPYTEIRLTSHESARWVLYLGVRF